MKKTITVVIFTFLLSALIFFLLHKTRLDEMIHWKFYGKLLESRMWLGQAPAQIKDIVMVTIDNETLQRLGKRWPFSRSDFASVIDNLNRAGAKVIAFDFVFLGESTPEEDAQLRRSILNAKVILATAVNEKGMIEFSSHPDLFASAFSGFVTKFQDRDGVIRRSLLYLVDETKPRTGVLSWGMQVLKQAKNINLKTLATKKDFICFANNRGEAWRVPVERNMGSFLINFRAHTVDFTRVSFCDVLENNFNAAGIKDKIVFVGLVSSLLSDICLTPIGWLPGVTLNANAFLTLYTQDFLSAAPKYLQVCGLILALLAAACAVSLLRPVSGVLFIVMELLLFIFLSYQLIIRGYFWNYALFPILVGICPLWAARICGSLNFRLLMKKYWT